ncbi:unnamed protein product [Phytophthora lilii]|uniref:Unnamed protein product n=1 Tax=Phytophthora lilii TaxID=2077276 RepID=A0A9W6TBR2_9STRA|nr:unnamed protein product [Phytophthora lilii]
MESDTNLARKRSNRSIRGNGSINSALDQSDYIAEGETTRRFTVRDANELSRPERGYFVMGMIGSAINGASFPASAVLISQLVAIMTVDYAYYQEYDDLSYLSTCRTNGERGAQVNGLAVGFSSFIVFATYAFAFWYGGKLVDDGSITFLQLMRSLMAIIMSSQSVGASVGYIADSDSAFEAGGVILSLFETDSYQLIHLRRMVRALISSRERLSSERYRFDTPHDQTSQC